MLVCGSLKRTNFDRIAEIHPMRAIFLIPTKPPPTLKNPDEWSTSFNDLIAKCLVKDPEERTTAEELLKVIV